MADKGAILKLLTLKGLRLPDTFLTLDMKEKKPQALQKGGEVAEKCDIPGMVHISEVLNKVIDDIVSLQIGKPRVTAKPNRGCNGGKNIGFFYLHYNLRGNFRQAKRC